MAVRKTTRDQQMRQRLALEAARILLHSGHHDYHMAKLKAAQHLGAADTRNLPSNAEIEQALSEHQRLFVDHAHSQRLTQLRQAALEAMRIFSSFRPRLVGSVLSGTASQHAVVELHLFADAPEEVIFFLLDQGVPYEEGQRRLRHMKQKVHSYPVYRFLAGDVGLELLVMPTEGMRQAPLSPVDGRPMQRATIGMVEELLCVDARES